MSYIGTTNAVVNVKCPYYINETKKCVSCEGIIDGSKNTMGFQSEDEKDTFIIGYCMRYPNECILSKALDNKYQGG